MSIPLLLAGGLVLLFLLIFWQQDCQPPMLILYPHTSLILTGDATAVMCDKRAPVTSDLVGCPPTWKAELRVPSAGAAAPPPGVVAAGGRMNVAEGSVTARGGRAVLCGAVRCTDVFSLQRPTGEMSSNSTALLLVRPSSVTESANSNNDNSLTVLRLSQDTLINLPRPLVMDRLVLVNLRVVEYDLGELEHFVVTRRFNGILVNHKPTGQADSMS
nr:uncharacterized protein LOC128779909 [Desmodus rotundus]